MIQLAVTALPEVLKLIKQAIEDPATYEHLEAIRQVLEKITGKEIDKNGLVALLEGVTQGQPFTGEWEANDNEGVRRARVDGGWIYDIGRGNGIFVSDK